MLQDSTYNLKLIMCMNLTTPGGFMRNLCLRSNLELIKKTAWRYVQEALNSQEVRINCNTLRETL